MSNDLREQRLESAIAQYLMSDGDPVRRQVACDAGIADIVTDTTVYEIKIPKSRTDVFKAIGQAISYRGSIDRNMMAAVVFPVESGVWAALATYARTSVRVLVWTGKRLIDAPDDPSVYLILSLFALDLYTLDMSAVARELHRYGMTSDDVRSMSRWFAGLAEAMETI